MRSFYLCFYCQLEQTVVIDALKRHNAHVMSLKQLSFYPSALKSFTKWMSQYFLTLAETMILHDTDVNMLGPPDKNNVA